MWIPKNKKTGVEYPEVSEEVKLAYEADPVIADKYTFIPVKETKPPKEAKKVTGLKSK